MYETVRMAIVRPSTRRAGLMLLVVLLAILATVAIIVGTLSPSSLAGLLGVVRSHPALGYGWWSWWWG